MSEHKIGEQWVEEIDGVKHMLKAVELTDSDFIDRIAMGEGGTCCICPLYKQCKASGNMEDFCPVGDSSSERSDYDDVFIKDLGILNKDGCLPAPWDSTKYPKITVLIGNVYNIEVMEGFWFMQVRGDTLEKAIDRWNRRA